VGDAEVATDRRQERTDREDLRAQGQRDDEKREEDPRGSS
jgi:hypothetical protein